MIAGLFDVYPKASSTKMIAGLFDAYSILKIATYRASSVGKWFILMNSIVFSYHIPEWPEKWLAHQKLCLNLQPYDSKTISSTTMPQSCKHIPAALCKFSFPNPKLLERSFWEFCTSLNCLTKFRDISCNFRGKSYELWPKLLQTPHEFHLNSHKHCDGISFSNLSVVECASN